MSIIATVPLNSELYDQDECLRANNHVLKRSGSILARRGTSDVWFLGAERLAPMSPVEAQSGLSMPRRA
ncbi:hypothetical protein [Mesorhizobium argentiipisi]|uniref:Transposase n=1 Tax=Mesorhizobium argentiipisi TaxID=3015175 RepID=A0ABU8KFS4_9HYPH